MAADSAIRSLYNLADAFWLGRWGKAGLAAPGVSMPFFFIAIAFGMGFGNAGTSVVSQYTGAKRYRQADRAAAQTLLLLCGLALLFAVPLIVFTPQLLNLAQVPADARAQAVPYLRVLSFGMPFIAFNIAYGSILRALGDTVTVLIIGGINNVINIVLDPFLIFGWGGLPEMGAAGAAVAGLISVGIGSVISYIFLRRGRAGLRVRLRDFKPDWPILRRILSIGFPAALNNSSTSVGFTILQVMINTLGTTVIGAFTVGFRVIFFFNIPTYAMSAAAAPVVGQSLGAGRPRLARRSVWLSAGLIAAIMFLPAVLLTWQGGTVAAAFSDSPGVVREARKFFLLMPLSSYFFGVLMVLMAAFYGSGHTRPAMVVGLLRSFALRLPIAYGLAFLAGWGSMGIYAGWITGNVTCALLTLYLFYRGGWETPTVETDPPPTPES